MPSIRLVQVWLISASLVAVPVVASAQAADAEALRQQIGQLRADFDMLRQQYGDRLSALEARLAALSNGPAIPAPQGQSAGQVPAPVPEPSAAQVPPVFDQAVATSAKVFNPDASVIGNFVGVAGKNPMSDQPSLSLTEVEAAFQAVVDPYARADFFLSASPEGLEVEEGYVTFTSLPAGVLLKVGKMRAQFGKANTMHTHILPWADRPLVLQNLFGGEEGLTDAGISASKLIPNGFMFIDAIGEVYRGNSEVFQSAVRSKLNYIGRLRGYRDLTEGTNIDLGVSYAHGPSAALEGFNTQLTGIDATFRYRPLRRAIYRQFVGRAELVWSRQDVPADAHQNASGLYASADYQFARRWFVGVRGDRAGRALESELHDSAGSIHLTFRPSEFGLVRGQYRRSHYAEGINANEILLQFNFSIGAHGAHPF